jgi:hypothetical protein
MICIKTDLKALPTWCDDCQWYDSPPHPNKGWTNICRLMSHSMDDDQPEEWVYDGNGRPKACPLVSTIANLSDYHLFTDDELEAHDQQVRRDFAAECCEALKREEKHDTST